MKDETQSTRDDNEQTVLTPEALFRHLADLDIDYPTIRHPALLTVEDARAHRVIDGGAHTKNLFLKNKKGRMWLLTLLEDRNIRLKDAAHQLGAGNFSFASTERLKQHLGIVPGAVSPLALINDRQCQVELILDQGILDFDKVHFHPLDNCMTTTLKREDFLRFLDSINHPPRIVTYEEVGD